MTLEERLNSLINEKEDKIKELEKRVLQIEINSDMQEKRWQMHESFQESALQKTLPIPRLEMRFKRIIDNYDNTKWYQVEWHYGIVYKPYAETDNDTMLFIPISRSISGGGSGTFDNWCKNGELSTPLRDGVHIVSESRLFKLPAYIVCEEKNIAQKVDLSMNMDEELSKMTRK